MVSTHIDDATRQYINEVIQKAITIAMTALQQRIDGVCFRQETLDTKLHNQNNGAMVRENQANRVNGYVRLTKLEFPRFYSDDFKGAVVEDPVADLKNLRQTSTIKVYQDQFDVLLSKLDITESHVIIMFLRGINTDIAMMVRLFKSKTLVDTYYLTNLQEATKESRTGSKIVYTCYKNVASASSGSYGGGNVGTFSNRPLLALPAPQQTTNSFLAALDEEEEELVEDECGCEMVLGIHFLSTLVDIKCNFFELRMEFKFNGKKGGHTNKELQSEIKQLLEESDDVFAVPKCLPPNKSLDHIIPLKEGVNSVNIRPYSSSVKTLMVPPNNLGPDLAGKPVNETLYKGMIGYLKGTPSLGLWYLKCSVFDLKGYSDLEYAGCNMDKKAHQVPAKFLEANWFVRVLRNNNQ
ncbi:hypothetical protein Tco_0611805 [Tanacetum coccineum]